MLNETFNTVGTYLDSVQHFLRDYPAMMLIVALYVVGRLIKASPLPNKFIPALLAFLGASLYPVITQHHPRWTDTGTGLKILFGLILGYSAVGIHQQLQKLAERFPLLQIITGEVSTSSTQHEKVPPPGSPGV